MSYMIAVEEDEGKEFAKNDRIASGYKQAAIFIGLLV